MLHYKLQLYIQNVALKLKYIIVKVCCITITSKSDAELLLKVDVITLCICYGIMKADSNIFMLQQFKDPDLYNCSWFSKI